MNKNINKLVVVLFTSILLGASATYAMEMKYETNLGLGSSGSQVIELQTTLESKGFLVMPSGAMKGYFGQITKRALMKYQQSLGVYSSGYYGPLTRASMKAMIKDGAMMEKKDGAMMAQAGTYEVYSADKIVNAKGKVVLFFRAGWCPTCRAVDADIRAHLGSIPKGVQILDVDYDNSSALKTKYGVTYQHTFVQVDTQGNQLKKWSSSPTLSAISAEII